MDIVKARTSIFTRVNTDFNKDLAALFIGDNLADPDLTKNYIRLGFDVISKERKSINDAYDEKITVSVTANIYTLLSGGNKIAVLEEISNIFTKGMPDLVLTGSVDFQNLGIDKTHQGNRVIAFYYFNRQNKLQYV